MSSGLPPGALKPADLSSGHTGAGQISPHPRKQVSAPPPKGVHWRVAKANYHQIRRQKELARKTRQQEKQQKRAVAKASEPAVADPDGVFPGGDPVTDVAGSSGGNEGS